MEIQQISNSGASGYTTGVAASSPPDARTQSATEVVKPAAEPVAVQTKAVQAANAATNSDRVKESVSKINKTIQALARDLQFTVDEDTQMSVVKVIDTQTKDVIRQIPSEEVLAIAKALDKVQGLLFKEKA